MPAVVPFLPYIVGGIGAVFKGIGAGQSRTGTSQKDSTETTEANLTRQQRKIMRELADIIRHSLQEGPTVKQAERDQGRTQINRQFNQIAPRLEGQLTARGFGDSGKLGAGFKGLEVGRANAFQDLEGNLRNEAQQRYERMLGLAQGFITPHNFTTTTHSTGSETIPGNLLGGLGGAFGDIGSLLLLKSLLGQGGAGSSPLPTPTPDRSGLPRF